MLNKFNWSLSDGVLWAVALGLGFFGLDYLELFLVKTIVNVCTMFGVTLTAPIASFAGIVMVVLLVIVFGFKKKEKND